MVNNPRPLPKGTAMNAIRPSVLSGTWYPADPGELARTVDTFLEAADLSVRPAGRPLIAVVPHAGYVYSGPTAGKLYGLLTDWVPRRLLLLAPSHRVALDRIALCGAAAFATPLGNVLTDQAAISELVVCESFTIDEQAHAEEHAIEIQLPLIQRTWPGAVPAIVPMLVPHLEPGPARAAAAAITRLADEDTLIVVSSDFTHYGQAYRYVPFTENPAQSLEKLDSGAILRILAADPAGLRAYGRETGITMCGLEAAAVALDHRLPAGYEGALIDYARSGDRDGDYSLSVSYAAVLLCSGRGGP